MSWAGRLDARWGTHVRTMQIAARRMGRMRSMMQPGFPVHRRAKQILLVRTCSRTTRGRQSVCESVANLEVRRQLLPRFADVRRQRLVARVAVQQPPHRRRRCGVLLPPLCKLLARAAGYHQGQGQGCRVRKAMQWTNELPTRASWGCSRRRTVRKSAGGAWVASACQLSAAEGGVPLPGGCCSRC